MERQSPKYKIQRIKFRFWTLSALCSLCFGFILAPLFTLAKDAAVIKHEAPSKYHIEGIKKIAFAPFAYTMSYHKNGSKHIPKMLRSELEKDGFFKIVSGDIEPLEIDEELTLPQLVKMGRRAGADAVISGFIKAFQFCGRDCSRMSNEAEVSFCVELINVKKAKVVDRRCYYGSGRKALKAAGELKDMPHEERIVLGTAKKVVSKVVRELVPHKSALNPS